MLTGQSRTLAGHTRQTALTGLARIIIAPEMLARAA
jgi:hypothetical protein